MVLPDEESDAVIDVVVPVFNNFDDTNRLFESLSAAGGTTRFALRIVDDASTAEGALRPPAVAGPLVDVSIVRNAPNRGFAASVNRALANSRRDVVILNTDTLVFGDWLDRLRAAAATNPRIATVTPFSTAATILSYPSFVTDHVGSLETGWGDIDAMCAATHAAPVEIPTGIGFCMLIRRACLDAIGPFDVAMFGAGYGEESDFCRRAVAAGWINVAAPNVFVWHRGSGSFGTRTRRLREESERRLRARHTDYGKVVARFIRKDPLRPLRARIDYARLQAALATRRLAFAGDMEASVMLKPTPSRWPRAWRPTAAALMLPNLPRFTRFTSRAIITRFLIEARITEVAALPRGDVPRMLAARIVAAAKALGIPIT